MNLLSLFLSLILLTWAQAPKPVDKPAPLPATIEIATKADVEIIGKARLDLENAQLKARNYELEIQQQLEAARKQLDALQKAAAEKQAKWQAMISTMTGIPADKLGEYQLNEKDGKWILTRKTPPTP